MIDALSIWRRNLRALEGSVASGRRSRHREDNRHQRLVVNAQMRNWVLVKVETDTPGLHGWGEATMSWKTCAVASRVEDFRPMLVGLDPTRIEFLWQIMYRHSYFSSGRDGHHRDVSARGAGVGRRD